MNVLGLGQTAFVSVISAFVGAAAALHLGASQESLRTKELVVEDAKGNPIVQIGSIGMSVYGTEPGSRIFFKHLGEQQIRFIRENNELVLSVGCFERGLNGMVAQSDSKVKSYFLSSAKHSAVAMVGSEDDRDMFSQFTGGIDGSNAIRLTAKEDRAEVQIAGLIGSTKTISNSSNATDAAGRGPKFPSNAR